MNSEKYYLHIQKQTVKIRHKSFYTFHYCPKRPSGHVIQHSIIYKFYQTIYHAAPQFCEISRGILSSC